jgi:hypothetical protein
MNAIDGGLNLLPTGTRSTSTELIAARSRCGPPVRRIRQPPRLSQHAVADQVAMRVVHAKLSGR